LANEEGAHHHPEFYRHKVACARWATGGLEGALVELNQIQGENSDLNEDWRFNFVEQVMKHINSIEAYSQLIAWLDLQQQAGRRGGDERVVRDANKARLCLVRTKYPKLGRPFASRSVNSDDFDVQPVLRLTVEAHEDRFPPGETWWEESQLLNEYLPAMRQRVTNESGITLPGVRFRAADSLPTGYYRLLIDEEPVASGQVEPGSRFFPKYDQVRHLLKDNAAAPQPALNPSTGIQEGAWVRPDHLQTPVADQRQWPEFLTAKLIQVWHRLGRRSRPANSDMAESWDQFEYIIRHLEAVAHAQLPRFLDIQTVQNMLDQWQQQDEERQRQCQDALPDDESLVRFVRVMQNLVAENVPVKDLDTILKQFTCLRSKGSDITDIVEHIRPALRDDASIDDRNRHLIRLDPGFESDLAHWVKGQNSRRFLTMPREEAGSFLAAIGQCVDGRPPRKVGLVVQDPDLRPFVKRLTAFSFPDLAVIAEHELEQDQLLLINECFKAPEQAKV
jgi:type III secretory pathway component EscV